MDPDRRAALEVAGYKIGDAADFLGLTAEEQQFVELRIRLARSVREWRTHRGMTQDQLAGAIGSSQARIAKVESGVGISLELMFRALHALGAGVEVSVEPTHEGVTATKDRRCPASRSPDPGGRGRKPRAIG